MQPEVRRRHAEVGVSILEIMLSFALMAVIIIAFATVFPSGYRLNFSNYNQNKAASIANSIAEELRAQDIKFLLQMQAYTPQQIIYDPTPLVHTPIGVNAPLNGSMFFIANGDIPIGGTTQGPGISVTVNQVGIPPNPPVEFVTNITIRVTTLWQESRRSGPPLTKSVSVVTTVTNGFRNTITH